MGISQLSSGGKAADEFSRTFVFDNEEYTLGHALECIITRLPEVKFCGVTVDTTSAKPQLFIQIQTYKARPVDMLKKGLEDLAAVTDHILDEFTRELDSIEMRERSST